MHVYHYADYERAALRRLAQAHGTREQEVDDLLRGEVLVDLFAVVRQSLVISEDSYSIKRLEKFYSFKRVTDVKKGDESIVMFEQWLQDRDREDILEDIERYNEDDCRSTLLLRDWLLERRKDDRAARHRYSLQTAQADNQHVTRRSSKNVSSASSVRKMNVKPSKPAIWNARCSRESYTAIAGRVRVDER